MTAAVERYWRGGRLHPRPEYLQDYGQPLLFCVGVIPLVTPTYPGHCDGCAQLSHDRFWGKGRGWDDGWRNGAAWAKDHLPGYGHPLAVDRDDDFFFGFVDGVVAGWCVEHPIDQMEDGDRCLARTRCQQVIAEQVKP